MASKKQKQELIDLLKFTPREITITFSGYGGEIVLGTIPEETYEFWKNNDLDVEELVSDYDGELDVPNEFRFITDGSWYDCDDICHESGCEMSSSSGIDVYDELEKRTIFVSSLEPYDLNERGIVCEELDEYYPANKPVGTCVFMGQSVEKGVFFSATFEITKPFDPKLLMISYHDCYGWMLVDPYVTYDDQEIDGANGINTMGKSSEFKIMRVGDD
jgi:hypothetical protein